MLKLIKIKNKTKIKFTDVIKEKKTFIMWSKSEAVLGRDFGKEK